MDENQSNLTQAFWTLGDWFHRLGGAATYPGFRESDIALFVVLTLAEHLGVTLPVGFGNVDSRFVQAATPVLPKVKDWIRLIRATPEAACTLLAGFVDYADGKIKQMHGQDSPAWHRLVSAVGELTGQGHSPEPRGTGSLERGA